MQKLRLKIIFFNKSLKKISYPSLIIDFLKQNKLKKKFRTLVIFIVLFTSLQLSLYTYVHMYFSISIFHVTVRYWEHIRESQSFRMSMLIKKKEKFFFSAAPTQRLLTKQIINKSIFYNLLDDAWKMLKK